MVFLDSINKLKKLNVLKISVPKIDLPQIDFRLYILGKDQQDLQGSVLQTACK